ncbi:Dynein light chain 2, cytoplasmic [Sparganum proliferum]
MDSRVRAGCQPIPRRLCSALQHPFNTFKRDLQVGRKVGTLDNLLRREMYRESPYNSSYSRQSQRQYTPSQSGSAFSRYMEQEAIDLIKKAFDRYEVGPEAAKYIKQEFDRAHSTAWHCAVGKHFAGFVTSELGTYVHLHYGPIAVLLWKCGISGINS